MSVWEFIILHISIYINKVRRGIPKIMDISVAFPRNRTVRKLVDLTYWESEKDFPNIRLYTNTMSDLGRAFKIEVL